MDAKTQQWHRRLRPGLGRLVHGPSSLRSRGPRRSRATSGADDEWGDSVASSSGCGVPTSTSRLASGSCGPRRHFDKVVIVAALLGATWALWPGAAWAEGDLDTMSDIDSDGEPGREMDELDEEVAEANQGKVLSRLEATERRLNEGSPAGDLRRLQEEAFQAGLAARGGLPSPSSAAPMASSAAKPPSDPVDEDPNWGSLVDRTLRRAEAAEQIEAADRQSRAPAPPALPEVEPPPGTQPRTTTPSGSSSGA